MDASQVYRDLRVLSARPSEAEEEAAPHRLFGYLDGAESCSAARWAEDAKAAIAHHHGSDPQRGRRREGGVPGDLGIEMGVQVDDAGHQGQPIGVKRAQGQLGAVARMLEEGRNCDEVVTQISAVSKAVNTAAFTLISTSLRECLVENLGNGGFKRVRNYAELKSGKYLLSIGNKKSKDAVKLYKAWEHNRELKLFLI